jgi:hypothetical protein
VTMFSDRRHQEPLFDIHPTTGGTFEVFYATRLPGSFGRGGGGWFWWPRRRGFAPEGPATGPFATSYAAYRSAILGGDLGANLGTGARSEQNNVARSGN